MNFSIIIPNNNGKNLLFDCINSLYRSISLCTNSNFEIILIDNGSSDNSCDIFKNFFTKNKLPCIQSTIHKLKTNTGFAKAVNYGILKSKYNWIVICNNDLTVKQDWFYKISKIISKNKDPKISTFFGTVLNKTGTHIESRGLHFFYSGKSINIDNKKNFIPNTKYKTLNTKKIFGASASIIIYNKKIITKIGLFDEDFFAYEEDVDLSLRLHNFGYKTLYIPNIFSYHLGGGTSNKMGNFRSKQDFKNWHYIIIKNFTIKQIFQNFFGIFKERLKNLSYLIKSTTFFLIPITLISVYFEIFINFPKMIRKRYQIQKMLKLQSKTNKFLT